MMLGRGGRGASARHSSTTRPSAANGRRSAVTVSPSTMAPGSRAGASRSMPASSRSRASVDESPGGSATMLSLMRFPPPELPGARCRSPPQGRFTPVFAGYGAKRNAGAPGFRLAPSGLQFRRPPNEHVQPEAHLGDEEQQDRFGADARRGGDRGARNAEPGDQHDAGNYVGGERRRVDERAGALLAHHVELPLDRADGGARP